jgi:two-component system LytT family response regulator
MNVLIVESSEVATVQLSRILEALPTLVKEINFSTSVKDGYQSIKIVTPDLVFLSMNLCDGTCLKLLNKYKKYPIEIVFLIDTLADSREILEEKQLNYIEFPFKKKQIHQLLSSVRINKMATIFSKDTIRKDYKNIKKISVKDKDGIRFIEIDKIVHCQSDNNYTEIYLENSERIVSSKSLKVYEILLVEHGFFRVHQSHLVDLKRIKRVISTDGLFVELENDILLNLSRRKKNDLLNKLKEPSN